MYLGMVAILLGIALLFGTVSPLIPVALFGFLMDIRFIRVEERLLAETFGEEWAKYRAAVRRWI
jgi:protein-S-isoprenylcysteine O-methyltransferase Ste14